MSEARGEKVIWDGSPAGSRAMVLKQGWLCFPGTFGNVWRHFGVSRLGEGVLLETRDAAKHPMLCEAPTTKKVVVQSLSHVWLFPAPWTVASQAPLPPSLSARACSKSGPLGWWCCLTVLSSTSPFFCLQSFPATGSFPKSRFFVSGGQSIEVSASASALPMNIQGRFHLGLTGLIFLVSQNNNSAEKMTWGELNLSHICKGLPTAKASVGDSEMSGTRSLPIQTYIGDASNSHTSAKSPHAWAEEIGVPW